MFERAMYSIMVAGMTVMAIMAIFASIVAHMELK